MEVSFVLYKCGSGYQYAQTIDNVKKGITAREWFIADCENNDYPWMDVLENDEYACIHIGDTKVWFDNEGIMED